MAGLISGSKVTILLGPDYCPAAERQQKVEQLRSNHQDIAKGHFGNYKAGTFESDGVNVIMEIDGMLPQNQTHAHSKLEALGYEPTRPHVPGVLSKEWKPRR